MGFLRVFGWSLSENAIDKSVPAKCFLGSWIFCHCQTVSLQMLLCSSTQLFISSAKEFPRTRLTKIILLLICLKSTPISQSIFPLPKSQ